jgi:BirA family biotin operon repressor/biotin-[acetyl-CoA-carboxylase] ligase
VRRFAEIDSTNRYLLGEARSGAAEGLVAVADHQTAGRGRLGRTWLAPAGSSLLVSVLLRPRLPPRRLHLVTAAVAMAACDACEAEAGLRPALKWPNDVMVDERKLAGVLAEAELPAVVAGLGLNVGWTEAPAGLADGAVSLRQATGRDVDKQTLLGHFLRFLDGYCSDWSEVGRAYRRRCSTVGRRVRVEQSGGSVCGTAVDVGDDGVLVVDVGGRRRRFASGDVTHLRPA